MTAKELYRAGKLREAIKALGDELKANPLDATRRIFLFELLLFAGEYDRAEKQLDFLATNNSKAAAGALLYRSALHAERTRSEMFAGGDTPEVKESQPIGGFLNGKPFDNIEDPDPRIGPNLEVFIAGSYTWIPFHHLRSLTLEKPVNLRDLVWASARVETSPEFRLQELGEVLIPALSPLSFRHPEEVIALGREVAWEPDEKYGEVPFGAKMMLVDGVEVPILELLGVQWRAEEKEEKEA